MKEMGTGRRTFMQAGAIAAASAAIATSARAQGNRNGRTYVLVHGAWFGGWVWKPVAEGLRQLGHTVYTPSLTGCGDRKHLIRPGINLDTHADDIINLIMMEDLKNVVLVGWSYSGMVVSDVLARIPDRIGSMVYLDAFAPETGKSQMDYANRNGSKDAISQMAFQGKDFAPLPVSSLGVSDKAIIDYCAARVVPHPVMTLVQASKALRERPANIPHTYVLAGAYSKQSSTFIPFYKMFQEDRRAKAIILETSHVMMLTDAKGTLDILATVA